MPRAKNQVPSYRRKKSRNLAFTTIEGSDIFLGKFGSTASKAEYARVLAEYAATGKVTKPGAIRMMSEQAHDDDLAISELLAKYMRFARAYYRKGGKETSEVHSLKTAFRPLRRLYGRLPASQFGPRELKAVRKEMIDAGWIRESINQHVARIRRFFRWCGEEEWVDGSVLANLKTVAALKVDRCDAAEGEEVSPVAMDVFQSTLPELVPMLRDMARVQLLNLTLREYESFSESVVESRPGPNDSAILRALQLGKQAKNLAAMNPTDGLDAKGDAYCGYLLAMILQELTALHFENSGEILCERAKHSRAVATSNQARSKKAPRVELLSALRDHWRATHKIGLTYERVARHFKVHPTTIRNWVTKEEYGYDISDKVWKVKD